MNPFATESKKPQRGRGKGFYGTSKQKEKVSRIPKPSTKIERPLNIKHLNFDSFERIFSHLSADDLSNMADAHPHFVLATRFVYKRLYGEHRLEVNESGCVLSIKTKINKFFHTFEGQNIKIKAKLFLRNFGIFIKSMKLDYLNSNRREKVLRMCKIEKYVIKYCANTLTVIWLENSFIVEPTKCDLERCFPNIETMKLGHKVLRNAKFIKRKFQSLKGIEFIIEHGEEDRVIENNCREIRRLNPHINDLIINGTMLWFTVTLLKGLSETLTQLQTLHLIRMYLVGTDSIKHIHFANLNSFIWLSYRSFYPDNISISFGQLKCLHLFGVGNDPKWIDFILQNRSLTSVAYGSNANIDDLTRIVTNLPELRQLIFETTDDVFTIEEFTHFLEICAPINNLKSIGKICSDTNWKNEISNLANMNDDLKNIFTLEHEVLFELRDVLHYPEWDLIRVKRNSN